MVQMTPSELNQISLEDSVRHVGLTEPVYGLQPRTEQARTSQRARCEFLDEHHMVSRRRCDGELPVALRDVAGGTSTGRTLSKICDVEDPNNLRFCDQSQYDVPLLIQFKLAGTYALPYGVRLGANFQSQPGAERIIDYAVVRSILPTLTQTSVNVRLNEPGTEYNARVNQLDLTLSKSFKNGGIDIRPEVAVFNVLNANPVLVQINTFGPSLGNVTTILNPRVLRLGVNVKV